MALLGFTTATATAQEDAPVVADSTLNHLQLNVKDLEATRDFYAKLFGARLVRKDTPQNWHVEMAERLPSANAQLTADRTAVDVRDPNGILVQISSK